MILEIDVSAMGSGIYSTVGAGLLVQDESTGELIAVFDRALKQLGVAKVEAMHQGRLTLLKESQYQHPYYSAAFVLVGNGL